MRLDLAWNRPVCVSPVKTERGVIDSVDLGWRSALSRADLIWRDAELDRGATWRNDGSDFDVKEAAA
jgi:hypothetical protein